MFVGIVRFELFIPASRSLKEKRRVIRSLTDAARRHCNVAIAEIDHQDLWQRTALGVSCVAGSRAQCEKVLQQVEKTMARTVVDGAEIVDRVFSYVSMEDLV